MDFSLDEIKKWACNLPILEYRNAPKNRLLIEELVDLIFANNILLKMRYGFDLETAEGAQLDIIGKWVGLDRYYNGIDLWEHPYTSLVNYSNIQSDNYNQYQGGLSLYSTFADNDGGFLMYKDWIDVRTKVNQMGDAYFRSLIKLKIIKNNINFTMKNIDDAIYQWSDGEIFTTWGTMEVTYHYPSDKSNLMLLAVYKDCLPAPTCCAVNTEVI